MKTSQLALTFGLALLAVTACTASPATDGPTVTAAATRPPTDTPPPPTETATLDPWREQYAAYAAAPCSLLLPGEVAALTGAVIEEAPVEEVGRDEPTDSVRSLCTYADVVVLTVVMPPQTEGLSAISDPSLGDAAVQIQPTIGQYATWHADANAISVILNYVWFSIRILTDGDARDLAFRMTAVVGFRLVGADPMAIGALPTPVGRPNISPCEAVTREEAGAILGPLTNIYVGGSSGELVGYFNECIYERGPADMVILSYIYYSTPAAALERHLEGETASRETGFTVSTVEGLGDAAYFADWGGGVGGLSVVAGTLSLSVSAGQQDDMAAMAEIAISRLVEVETAPETPAGGFSSCDALGRSQIESIIGPLNRDPILSGPSGTVEEGTGLFSGCVYRGAAANAFLTFGPFLALGADAYWQEVTARSGLQPVAELAVESVWLEESESQGVLSAMRGDIVLEVQVSAESADLARVMAIQIARIALVRIPEGGGR